MATTRFGVLVRSFSTSGAIRQLIQPPMQVFGVEGRYATALYSAAMKNKALDAVDKDVKEMSGLLKNDPMLKEFLLNPLLSKELKREALHSVLTKKKASDLTKNLFDTLAENGRLNMSESVLSAFGTIMAAVKGEVVCEITTAKPLDAVMRKDLESSLQAFTKPGESLHITIKVDPSILGGMLVSIGDRYVDMSLASKISRYTSLLQQAV